MEFWSKRTKFNWILRFTVLCVICIFSVRSTACLGKTILREYLEFFLILFYFFVVKCFWVRIDRFVHTIFARLKSEKFTFGQLTSWRVKISERKKFSIYFFTMCKALEWTLWANVILAQVISGERRIRNKKFKISFNCYECHYRRKQNYFNWAKINKMAEVQNLNSKFRNF